MPILKGENGFQKKDLKSVNRRISKNLAKNILF